MNSSEVVEFILTQASAEDLAEIKEACSLRKQALLRSVKVGDAVRVTDGISPKYLTGLTGTFKSRKGKRVTIVLDTKSTAKLRSVSDRFFIPAETKEYTLAGLPEVCVVPEGA
jgi:hypothetical protein